MNVLYDSQIFSSQRYGGISRYFSELIHGSKGYEYQLSLLYSDNEYIKDIHENSLIIPSRYFLGKNTLVKYLNKYNDIKELKSSNFDLFHPTYYSPALFPQCPIVITVYDMIHELQTDYFSPSDKTIGDKFNCLKKASRIIAISENTKKDLLNKYKWIEPDRVDVVYLAIEWDSVIDSNDSETKYGDYILFTGNRERYKNFSIFLRAVIPLLSKYNLNLVITGPKVTDEEYKFFCENKINDKIFHVAASESTLKSLYSNAIAFVFPSLYEGFGLPILEAFSTECPIVLSNTSCFPEIAGDAGEYFDPYDCNSIRNAIETVISSKDRRAELKKKGLVRKSEFTYEKMIQETYKVYKKALACK